MTKGISKGEKMHKNRDKEFFNWIAGKYRLSGNALSVLPKLTYLETAHMISYVVGNRFFVNEKLNLKNYSIKKQVYNNYFNYTTKKVSMNNYGTNNYRTNSYRTYNYNLYNYVKNNFRSGYNAQENESSYKAKLNISVAENTRRKQSSERSINGVDEYGRGILTGSSYASPAKKVTARVLTHDGVPYFSDLNNMMRQFFSESNSLVESAGSKPMVAQKTVRSNASKLALINTGVMAQRLKTVTGLAGIYTADYDNLARETKAKNEKTYGNSQKDTLQINDRFYGLGSENKSNSYSDVYRRNGIKANAGSIYDQSPGLELAVNEAARNKTKKSEAPSQNIVSEGTKEVNKQTPLDINKIVSQVYNELERKFRIERERRGL